MDKQSAELVALLLEEAVANIGQAMHTAMEKWSPDEYARLREQSADIVGNISVHLLDPIYARFPEVQSEMVKHKEQFWCYREQE